MNKAHWVVEILGTLTGSHAVLVYAGKFQRSILLQGEKVLCTHEFDGNHAVIISNVEMNIRDAKSRAEAAIVGQDDVAWKIARLMSLF